MRDVDVLYVFSTCRLSRSRCLAPVRKPTRAGVVEYIASGEYMVRPPQPPVFMFLLEVSLGAVQSGALEMQVRRRDGPPEESVQGVLGPKAGMNFSVF